MKRILILLILLSVVLISCNTAEDPNKKLYYKVKFEEKGANTVATLVINKEIKDPFNVGDTIFIHENNLIWLADYKSDYNPILDLRYGVIIERLGVVKE